MQNIEHLLRQADVTSSDEWNRSVRRIAWERDDEGEGEHAEISITASLVTLVPYRYLPVFMAHQVADLAADAMNDPKDGVLADLFASDGIERDGVTASVDDSSVSIEFGPHACRIVFRATVAGSVRRSAVAA